MAGDVIGLLFDWTYGVLYLLFLVLFNHLVLDHLCYENMARLLEHPLDLIHKNIETPSVLLSISQHHVYHNHYKLSMIFELVLSLSPYLVVHPVVDGVARRCSRL